MSESAIITTHNVHLWYNEKRALESVSIKIPRNKVTALIGPSGLREVNPAPLLQPTE